MEIWGSPVTVLPIWSYDPLGVDSLHIRTLKRQRELWEGDLEIGRANKHPRISDNHIPPCDMEFDLVSFGEHAGDCAELPMELLLDPLVPCYQSSCPTLTPESQLRDYLNQIAFAFFRPSFSMAERLTDLTCLLRNFNQIYDSQSKEMCRLDECAHICDIAAVIEWLDRVKDDQNWDQFKIEGFWFLGLLARNTKGRELIATTGCLQLIAHQLKHTSSIMLFEKCCFVLGNSITSFVDKDENFADFIEESEIFDVIFKRITQGFGNSTIQVCFFALGNLMFSGNFESTIIRLEGIGIAFKTIEERIDDDQLLADIICFLKNMACGVKGANTVVTHPSLLILPTLMQRYSHNSQLCQLCVQLIFDLSFSGSPYFEALASASVGLILGFLKSNSCDKLSKESIRTLSKLFLNSNPEGKIRLLKEGLVDVVKAHLSLTNRRLGRQFLNQLSSCTLVHQKLPTREFPSLLELTARKLVETGNSAQIDLLCPDLKDFLSKGQLCSHCHNPYFDYSFERLDYHVTNNFANKVPKINSYCSRKCFDETVETVVAPDQEIDMFLN